MNKGLEALKHIRECVEQLNIKGIPTLFQRECYDIIEKELKALEIIKEKASIDLLNELNDDEPYWLDIACGTKISKEEYDLLKEVLL